MKQEIPTPETWEDYYGRNYETHVHTETFRQSAENIEELLNCKQGNRLAQLSRNDILWAVEPLSRRWFRSRIWDSDRMLLAAPECKEEFHNVASNYYSKLHKLTCAIRERSQTNRQAQELAAAIERLMEEVADADAIRCNQNHKKQHPVDLLSDARHGELWDSVEKAIIELSTPRAEANADIGAVVRAELRKSEAKDIKRSQRERAADKIKAEYAKKKTCSFEDAAQWVLCNPTADEKRGGAYDDVTSFTTQLYKDAERLGIKNFINRKRGRPRKQKAADLRTTQAEGERPPDRARRLPVAVRCPAA